MLTLRQIHIVTYFVNHSGWNSGEDIAAFFRIDKKTLRTEINGIQGELGEGFDLETGKKGYRLDSLSDAAKKMISHELFYHGGDDSLGIRPSSFIIYLLFQNGFVSMQQCADSFYLSKTAVALTMEVVKRWIERSGGLSLVVSGNWGIRIEGSEKRKRLYLAKFGSVNSFRSIPMDLGVCHNYEAVLRTVRKILQPLLLEYDCLVTGDDFRKGSRLIADCILRSRMGYTREADGDTGMTINRFLQSLREQVLQALQYELTDLECKDIWEFLEESSLLSEPGESIFEDEPDITCHIYNMEKEITDILGLDRPFMFHRREFIIQHLQRLLRRNENGNIAVNNVNEEITAKYPLEVHLMHRFVRKHFGKSANKETSLLALFLATDLEALRDPVSVLLVTDQVRSVAYHIENAIRQVSQGSLLRFDTTTVYGYRNRHEQYEDYNILLTTEMGMVFREQSFFRVPPIIRRQDIVNLHEYIQKRREELHMARMETVKRILPVQSVHVVERAESIEQVLGIPADKYQSYHLIGERALFICRTCPQASSGVGVKRFELQHPILFARKRIEEILYVNIPERNKDLLNFFDYVSGLLSQL